MVLCRHVSKPNRYRGTRTAPHLRARELPGIPPRQSLLHARRQPPTSSQQHSRPPRDALFALSTSAKVPSWPATAECDCQHRMASRLASVESSLRPLHVVEPRPSVSPRLLRLEIPFYTSYFRFLGTCSRLARMRAVSGWSGPRTRSKMARARSNRGRAAVSSPWAQSRFARLLRAPPVSGVGRAPAPARRWQGRPGCQALFRWRSRSLGLVRLPSRPLLVRFRRTPDATSHTRLGCSSDSAAFGLLRHGSRPARLPWKLSLRRLSAGSGAHPQQRRQPGPGSRRRHPSEPRERPLRECLSSPSRESAPRW